MLRDPIIEVIPPSSVAPFQRRWSWKMPIGLSRGTASKLANRYASSSLG